MNTTVILGILMLMKAWHIRHWNDLYENNTSRTVQTLSYYCQPNKLFGEGIGHMLMQPDGLELYGVFGFLKALASSAMRQERGWLYRNGAPMDAARMSALTRIPVEKIQRALEFFSTKPMDWIEEIECPISPPTADRQCPISPPTADRQCPISPPTADRQHFRRMTDDKGTEDPKEDTHYCAGAPSLSEVRTWATETGRIHPDFAELKFKQAVERREFEKGAWQKGWQAKFKRFWEEDGLAWSRKNKKNARRNGEPPAGWKSGDAKQWWSDLLADVRATLSGAVLAQDEKTAARLREIIALREQAR